MRSFALIALTLAAGLMAVHAQEVTDFPFYNKCSKGPSPYSLAPIIEYKGGSTYCFTVKVNPVPGCSGACCTSDLRKIELNVKPECYIKGTKFSATVNGQPASVSPSMDQPASAPAGGTILRITGLGLGLESDNAEVCLTIGPNASGEGCLKIQDFCKPRPGFVDGYCHAALFDSKLACCPESDPHLPVPKPNFPACQCQVEKGLTPFGASSVITESAGATKGTTRYCFTTTVLMDASFPCANANTLFKAEVYARDTLRKAVKALYVKAADSDVYVKKSASWAGTGSNTLKFTSLNWSTEKAAGGKLCIDVDASVSLKELCMGQPNCLINFFNDKMDCCPVFDAMLEQDEGEGR